jgi:hypothetical protein
LVCEVFLSPPIHAVAADIDGGSAAVEEPVDGEYQRDVFHVDRRTCPSNGRTLKLLESQVSSFKEEWNREPIEKVIETLRRKLGVDG